MRWFILAACVFIFPQIAYAQYVVDERQSLSFGEIIADPYGDVITVKKNNRITRTGASDLLGGHSRAEFNIQGEPRDWVFYSFISNDLTNDLGEVLVLDNFQTNRSNPFRLNNRGRKTMRVGADITVPPNIRGGKFTGSYILSFDYY